MAGSQTLPTLPGIPKESADQIRVLAQTVHRLNSRIAAFESGIRPEQVTGLKQALDSKVPVTRRIWTQPPMRGGRDLSADLTIETPTGAGGVSSLDGLTGDVTLVAGTDITIANNTPSPGDIRISSTAGGGVTSLDGITGAITLVAGSNITITDNSPSAGDITIAATGGGGSTSSVFTQTDVTSSRSKGTVYQNTTGNDLLVMVEYSANGTATSTALTDSSNPPTTAVCTTSNSNGFADTLYFFVKNNDYYEITGTNIPSIGVWREVQITKGSLTDSGDLSGSRAFTTVYQNTGTTPLMVEVQLGTLNSVVSFLVGTSSPPTTVAWEQQLGAGAAQTLLVPVLPNEYYELTNGGTGSIVAWHEYSWSAVTGTRFNQPSRVVIVSSTGAVPGYIDTAGKSLLQIVAAQSTSTSTLIMKQDIQGSSPTTASVASSIVTARSSGGNQARTVLGVSNSNATYSAYIDAGTATTNGWNEWTFA